MKLFLHILCVAFFSIGYNYSNAQCTTTTLNWDNLSFLNTTVYGSGILTSPQNFAFGANKTTVTHSTNITTAGVNGSHTGETNAFGKGDDVEFGGTGTITITFQNEVNNVKFSIFDIDGKQSMVFTAKDAANAAQNINVAGIVASTDMSIANSGTTSVTVTDTETKGKGTAQSLSSQASSVNVSIPGPVKSITISNNIAGDFWLSDIEACSSGSFPINYQQVPLNGNKPYTGQPDYFLTTPDNNSVYMVDPATGKAWELFKEATGVKFVNSLAYDPYHHVLYYVIDGSSAANMSGNKKIKKYDFELGVSSDYINDISALGIPTFDQGVESAAASYYNGALYLGIEGGIPSGSSDRESIIWKIDIDNAGNPSQAYQVFSAPSAGHDWGDFMVKDGALYDFNTSASNTQFKHFNLITGVLTDKATSSAGQVGMTWAGDMYAVKNSVQKYDPVTMALTGTAIPITVVRGTAWVGNAGDASEGFRPKADFGDAPAGFDPDALAPALHEYDPNLRLGASVDFEWNKKSSTLSDGDAGDDGLPYARIMNLSGGNYQTDLKVFNNTGADAMVCAWIDFNNNNTFESGEGIEQVVSTNAAMQTISLYWNNIAASLPNNSYTVLRIRITSLANGMTKSKPTGYFANGEIEDYRIPVNATTLAVKNISFQAGKEKDQVQLKWNVAEDKELLKYIVERSVDGLTFNPITEVRSTGTIAYTYLDAQPLEGKSFYRLQLIERNGQVSFTEARTVSFENIKLQLAILSNPAINNARIQVLSPLEGKGNLRLLSFHGGIIYNHVLMVKKGYSDFSIPISSLPAGQYIIQIQLGSISEQKKLLIVK